MDKNIAKVVSHLVAKLLDLEIKNAALTKLLITNEVVSKKELEEIYDTIADKDVNIVAEEIIESLNKYVADKNKPVEYNESFGEWKDNPNKPWW